LFGAVPQTPLGSLQRSPDALAAFKGKGREEEERGKGAGGCIHVLRGIEGPDT